jgi:chloramphenicol 3-O-phosphotransferase
VDLVISTMTGIQSNILSANIARITGVNTHCIRISSATEISDRVKIHTSAVFDSHLKAHRLNIIITKALAAVNVIAVDTEFSQILRRASRFTIETKLNIAGVFWSSRRGSSRDAHRESSDRGNESGEVHFGWKRIGFEWVAKDVD